jgi:exodeoxyribonuclease VII small subunit
VSKKTSKAPAQLPFEDALARIEAIIDQIESGDHGLEASIAAYEEGVRLVQQCRGTLDGARRKVEDLTRKLDSADTPDDDAGDDPPEDRVEAGDGSDDEAPF